MEEDWAEEHSEVARRMQVSRRGAKSRSEDAGASACRGAGGVLDPGGSETTNTKRGKSESSRAVVNGCRCLLVHGLVSVREGAA